MFPVGGQGFRARSTPHPGRAGRVRDLLRVTRAHPLLAGRAMAAVRHLACDRRRRFGKINHELLVALARLQAPAALWAGGQRRFFGRGHLLGGWRDPPGELALARFPARALPVLRVRLAREGRRRPLPGSLQLGQLRLQLGQLLQQLRHPRLQFGNALAARVGRGWGGRVSGHAQQRGSVRWSCQLRIRAVDDPRAAGHWPTAGFER